MQARTTPKLVRARRVSASVGLLAVVVTMAGCSQTVPVGAKSISRSDVESGVAAEIARQQGVPIDQVRMVTCPGDIEARVGATMTCELGDAGSDSYDVGVAIIRIDPSTGRATFSAKVASQPNSA